MIITHASKERILEVKSWDPMSDAVKGCLFFGSDGNEYNLAGSVGYQYNLEVDRILDVTRIWYEHEEAELEDILAAMTEELGIDEEQAASLLEESEQPCDLGLGSEQAWIVQQYQGLAAHALGYDCAESTDEQGAVYIAYCVGRTLVEVAS